MPPDPHEISILVVDDEDDLRTLIRRRLERAGWYTVIGEATTTRDAINLAEAHQPDVILLDLLLGSEHGVDAIGDLLRAAPRTMIAALTVLSAEDQEPTVKAAGAFVFYEKTMLVDLPGHLRDDLFRFHRAIAGEDVVAPSAITRRA